MNTKAPVIQQHELTYRCNDNCKICYNIERCMKIFQPSKEDRQKNLLVAETSIQKGVLAACPTGGEPLLVGEHLFDVLDIYKQAGCYTSINSNGRLITKKSSKKLAQTKLNSALISIHGIGGLHNEMVGDQNAFSETWQGIVNLREVGISVTPNFVATAKNIHGLLDVGKSLSKIKIHSMTVTPFLPSWGFASHKQFVMRKNHYQIYFDAVREIRKLGIKIDSTLPIPPCVLIKLFPDSWRGFIDVHSPRVCMAGKSFGVVSPAGYFRACIQAPPMDNFGGNILNNYTQSWKNANQWAEKKLLPDECLKCEALDICGGGCRTSCLWENHGSIKGTTMYMGEPLNKEQASIFIERIKVKSLKTSSYYKWRKNIKSRDEGWGVIIFNPRNQSFTVLSTEFKNQSSFKNSSFTIASSKVAKTLLAIGAIRKTQPLEQKTSQFSNQVKVLPANRMFPRLAASLNCKNEIYCLRSDTGERYFF